MEFRRFPRGQKGVCELRVGRHTPVGAFLTRSEAVLRQQRFLKCRLRSVTQWFELAVSHFDGDLRRCQASLDFDQRLSRLWFILEVDCADAQREVIARRSEGK